MKQKPLIIACALIACSPITAAQSADLNALIRQAQDRSSRVKSAQSIVEARRASLLGTRSPSSPILELAPGTGFTNSNSVLSQEFDLFGKRRAASQLAAANLKAAELLVLEAKAEVSLEMLTALARILSARDEVEAASSGLGSAKALLTAVSKQNEIGEAPQVHVTRAEIDVLRATQQLTEAEGRLKGANYAMNSILGGELEIRGVIWPTTSHSNAFALSFDLLRAQLELETNEAQTRVARSDFAPSFSAGVASDIWSLDRDRFRGNNFGFQITLRMPLYDSGQRKGAVRSSELQVQAAQSRIDEERRKASLRLVEATAAHATAKSIAESYVGDVLPKGELMLTAMREGYAAGLVTLVEVLESQQIVVKLRQERGLALFNLRLAEIELWRAQLTIPGVEVTR